MDGSTTVVFDDCPWKFIPNKKAFFGCQQNEFTVVDKYRGKRSIRFGGVAVYICNPDMDPRNEWTIDEREFYDINSIFITINNPLF